MSVLSLSWGGLCRFAQFSAALAWLMYQMSRAGVDAGYPEVKFLHHLEQIEVQRTVFTLTRSLCNSGTGNTPRKGATFSMFPVLFVVIFIVWPSERNLRAILPNMCRLLSHQCVYRGVSSQQRIQHHVALPTTSDLVFPVLS